jgi:hypothetical protein
MEGVLPRAPGWRRYMCGPCVAPGGGAGAPTAMPRGWSFRQAPWRASSNASLSSGPGSARGSEPSWWPAPGGGAGTGLEPRVLRPTRSHMPATRGGLGAAAAAQRAASLPALLHGDTSRLAAERQAALAAVRWRSSFEARVAEALMAAADADASEGRHACSTVRPYDWPPVLLALEMRRQYGPLPL